MMMSGVSCGASMCATAFFMLVIGIIPSSVLGQDSNRRTDTFEQRYPDGQTPAQPPTKGEELQPSRSAPQRHSVPSNKVVKLSVRFTQDGRSKRPASRVIVKPRSFLDAGTQVRPGERKFLDYALPPLHTPMDVVTNTGGRVGWHNSPLPGPLFPGIGPW
jgi:hypothetical protein